MKAVMKFVNILLLIALTGNILQAQSSGVANEAVLNWDGTVGCLEQEIGSADIYNGISIQNFSDDICLNACELSIVNYSIEDLSNTIDTVSWTVTGGFLEYII
jgi:hypothetical protein